jgi:DNA invertase Pin-like site-specific DNA recombinase
MYQKVQPYHLNKIAYLYLRQSTPQQLIDHQESLRVQLRLKDKLEELGFGDRIEVVDSDLGKSAAGYMERNGFNYIMTNVCHERAGAVASWEASRLARSHFEWQKLIRFCKVSWTLVIDESGIYDPTNLDDMAMLGIKAALSEYELNLLVKRAQAGILEKASRGELYRVVPTGYYLTGDNKLEMDPNERIRETIQLVFDKFDQEGSARQVLLWFLDNHIEFPKVSSQGGNRQMIWEPPGYSTIYGVLTNPIYAGAYVYGRTKTKTMIRNNQLVKTSGHPVAPQDWTECQLDHHEGYISWERFVNNRQRLGENAGRNSACCKGAARMGSSLLAGLIHCGHCGRRLAVKYSGRQGKSVRYVCPGAQSRGQALGQCFSISANKLERAVVREVLQTIQPAGITAALEAEQQLSTTKSDRQRWLQLELEQARYEADRRERQFNAVEPENRLVIRELQALWDQALNKVERLEQDLKREQENHRPIDESQRQQLYWLATDLVRLWELPSTDDRTKTRIIRTVIEDIVAKSSDDGEWHSVAIHWVGGIHSEIRVKKNKRGDNGRATSQQAVALIKQLAEITDDGDIARVLNRCGLKTGTGQSWNQSRVKRIRQQYQIPAFCPNSHHHSGLLNLGQTADQLAVSPDTVMRLIKAGVIKARQIVKHAPWMIHQSELAKPAVIEAVKSINNNGAMQIQIDQTRLEV